MIADRSIDEFSPVRTSRIRDLGAYDLIDGCYASGTLHVHLARRAVHGEQPLARHRRLAFHPSPRLSRADVTTARFIEPMRCRLVEALPGGDDWGYEIKRDAYSAVAVKTDELLGGIPEGHAKVVAEEPVGRIGNPEEIAAAVICGRPRPGDGRRPNVQ